MLSVTEPMSTGLGGDVFSIVWDGRQLGALDGGLRAQHPSTEEPMPNGGQSATVPGAVAGWAALSERYGNLGLDSCLQDAIDIARRGFAVGSNTARIWSEAERVPSEFLPRPAVGDRVSLPELGDSLEPGRTGARRAVPGPDSGGDLLYLLARRRRPHFF